MSARILCANGAFFTGNLTRRSLLYQSPIKFFKNQAQFKTLKLSFLPSIFQSSRGLSFNLKRSFTTSPLTKYSPTWRDLGYKSFNRHGGGGAGDYQQLILPFGVFLASSVVMYYLFPVLFKIPPFNVFNTHPQLLVYSIILANIAVFFLWRIPRCYSTLSKHFLLKKPLTPSTYSSMLGSLFSHQEGWHLMFNMLMLFSFGGSFVTAVGPLFFLFMYCSSAMFASLASLAWPVLLRIAFVPPSLGASGALFSLFSTVAYLFPTTKLSIMFIPFPGGAWTLMLAFSVLNAAGLILRWGGMDYAAHLGGTAIGVFYGWFLTKQKEKRMRQRRRVF